MLVFTFNRSSESCISSLCWTPRSSLHICMVHIFNGVKLKNLEINRAVHSYVAVFSVRCFRPASVTPAVCEGNISSCFLFLHTLTEIVVYKWPEVVKQIALWHFLSTFPQTSILQFLALSLMCVIMSVRCSQVQVSIHRSG